MKLSNEIHAPITKGDKLGTLVVSTPEGDKITMPLKGLKSIEESGFLGRLFDSFVLFFLKLTGGDPLEFSQ